MLLRLIEDGKPEIFQMQIYDLPVFIAKQIVFPFLYEPIAGGMASDEVIRSRLGRTSSVCRNFLIAVILALYSHSQLQEMNPHHNSIFTALVKVHLLNRYKHYWAFLRVLVQRLARQVHRNYQMRLNKLIRSRISKC